VSTFLQAFRSRRVAIMLPLGFASGLPNPLIGSTLTAWMSAEGVDLTTIGLFAWVAIPYNLKVLWSPLLDRFFPPLLDRRRGWILLTQLALALGIAGLGLLHPARTPWLVAAAALAVCVLSASQDIVSDAYRTDLLPPHERASGSAVFVSGYRLAMLAAGAGALILAPSTSWSAVYAVLGLLMGVGVLATWLAPRTPDPIDTPHTLRQAYAAPLRELASRPRMGSLLVVVTLYKLGDAMAGHLLIPFLHRGVGFSLAQIGATLKGLGLAATIGGALLGGGLVGRFGIRRTLFAFGLLQSLANASYAWLAYVGHDAFWFTVAIGVDNLFNGLGTAAYVAFLMSLCDHCYTATQYAVLTSFSTLAGRLLSGATGPLVQLVGWPGFFLISIAIAVPALLLIPFVPIQEGEASGSVDASSLPTPPTSGRPQA